MTYRACLFDFDLTLADSSEGILKCYREVLRRHGAASVSDAAIMATVGKSVAQSLSLLTGETCPEVIESWLDEYRECADKWMTAGTRLYPESVAVLAELRRRGVKLAIVSTKMAARIEEFLVTAVPAGTFDVIVGGRDVKAVKPDPEGLLLAIRRLGVAHKECLFVGDTVIDAQAASRAAIDFAGILHGLTTETAFSAWPAKRIMKNLNEILEMIE